MTLTFLKDKFPQSCMMYVCNKVDITKEAQKYDKRSAWRLDSIDQDDNDDDGDDHDDDDDDDDDDDEEEEDEDEEEEEEDEEEEERLKVDAKETESKDGANGSKEGHLKEANKEHNKGEAVYNQLKDKYDIGETWETCPSFHAISAREVRIERLEKRETEATRRFRRFESSLQDHLGKVMKTQTRRVVQKLSVLQESFVHVVQVQKTSITQQASVVPQILTKAAGMQEKMIKSLSAITLKSEESERKVLRDLKILKINLLHEAEVYKVEKLKSLEQEFPTKVKSELPAYSKILLNANFDIALVKFVDDLKESILEKTSHILDKAVEVLMKDHVNNLTIAITDFNADLRNPVISRILEELYDIQFLTAKAQTDQLLQLVVNGLLDSMSEVAKIALRTEISEPLSKCLCPEDLSCNTTLDVRKTETRLNICETLLATINSHRVVDAVREACTNRLLKIHEQLMDALSSFASLQAAFENSDMSLQLEVFRVRFTPEMRKLTVEGMALQYLQIFGPVTVGEPIAQARHGVIYECTSEHWCRVSPTGQCVVKVLDKKEVDENAWNQTAVDLVNIM